VFVTIPFFDIFIPDHSTPSRPLYGWGYFFYLWGLLFVYAVLFISAFRSARKLHGGARLEMQVWLGGGCILAFAIYALMFLSAFTGNPIFRRAQPIATLFFYAGTAYAISHHRIFDAREIVVVGFKKAVLVFVIAIGGLLADRAFLRWDSFLKWLVVAGIVVVSLEILNRYIGSAFSFSTPDRRLRKEAFEVAQKESRIERLEAAFVEMLRTWGHASSAHILYFQEDGFPERIGRSRVVRSSIEAILEMEWVTPERLDRERRSGGSEDLKRIFSENDIGVMIGIRGSDIITLFGVGVGPSRRPYTYPQVVELMELAAIMESALERAHFAAKVQRAEQLAALGLVGASLAHEIRNPLVSIKTFVQLLPTHHADPVFREKFSRLVGGEVQRIDDLTQQLLDLAAPRTYQAELLRLHAAVGSGLELVQAKAAERGVRIETDWRADPDAVFTDGGVVKQVLLNLGFNAIQAAEEKGGADRWIRISTRNVEEGVELAVTDSGPGIAPEFQRRLFQPFQTTKSRGFGLGLAICRDILANVHATITVDPTVPGQGATFRVTYPCQSPSS
jgi:signal transduction histidine kinase